MRTTLLIILVSAVGCASAPEDTVVYAPMCPTDVCSTNSQEVARNGMHEANLWGELDENKISLETRLMKDGRRRAQIWNAAGRPFDLHVEKARMFGVDPNTGETLERDALRGARLHVLQSYVPIYQIRIDGFRTLPMPVGDTSEKVEVYKMVWLPEGSTTEGELCEVPDHPFDPRRDQDQLFGLETDEAITYEGDRVKANEKTMNRNEEWDPNWFNFGCAGRTLAKMYLVRETQASGSRKWETRQAALKMMTGDYCGKGVSFTRTGTHIGWKDDQGLVDSIVLPTEIEARWNEKGATCLSTPRRQAVVPYILDYILTPDCLLTACYDTDLTTPPVNDLDGARIVSALYH